MTISTRENITRAVCWDVWWRWSILSLVGVVLGALLLGSVVVIYPGAIWLLLAVGLEDGAWFVWFLGLGGSAIYGVAQWLTPLRWISINKRWWIWLVAAVAIGPMVLQISNYLASIWQTRLSATDPGAMIATWGIYYVLMGLILAFILQVPTIQPDMTTTQITE
jgi:hypothetical protein